MTPRNTRLDQHSHDIRSSAVQADSCHDQSRNETLSIDVVAIVNQLIAWRRIRAFFVRADVSAKLRVGRLTKVIDLPRQSAEVIAVSNSMISAERRRIEREIVKLAKQLPVVADPWFQTTRGFGWLRLGLTVGESGDLTNYTTCAQLWKRHGLAVNGANGRAQGRRRGEAGKVEGFCPRRRAAMYIIGECLLRGNRGYYKKVYDERKAYEVVRLSTPENIAAHPPSIDRRTGKPKKYSPVAHAHNRAQRYMEKRFLLHLWQAWKRQATEAEAPVSLLPATNIQQSSGRLIPVHHMTVELTEVA